MNIEQIATKWVEMNKEKMTQAVQDCLHHIQIAKEEGFNPIGSAYDRIADGYFNESRNRPSIKEVCETMGINIDELDEDDLEDADRELCCILENMISDKVEEAV